MNIVQCDRCGTTRSESGWYQIAFRDIASPYASFSSTGAKDLCGTCCELVKKAVAPIPTHPSLEDT